MSILDIFRTKPATLNTPAIVANNPTVPSDANVTNKAPGEASPNDKYNKLWEIDPNAPKPPSATSFVPSLDLDPAKLKEAAGKLDFTAHIKPELFAKVAAGGDEAAIAMRDIINQASQLSFAQGIAAAGELNKQSLTQAQTALNESVLPAALRAREISKEVARENPIFADPAISPLMKVMENQFALKYPTASAEEIAAQAKDFLSAMSVKVAQSQGRIISDPKGKSQGLPDRPTQDWEDYFNLATSKTTA